MSSLTLPPKKVTDTQRDGLYNYDPAAAKAADDAKPWRKDPNYFKTVRISAMALVKMVMHARSGGQLEVMGLMQGYVDGTALVVTDAFRLPVEGTETRVNAQQDAYEYMVQYLDLCRAQGRLENAVGWYHSHPGYGCWLSGIDVDTQALQQLYSDPFVAVVVDPDRTVSTNKVEIGAFRTYPEDYKPPAAAASSGAIDQVVPTNKAEDFGAHASRYYSLEVEHFKSTLDSLLLDQLWNKYWVQTLAQNPLLTNREFGTRQIADAALKVKDVAATVTRTGRAGQGFGVSGKSTDQAVEKVVRSTRQVAAKEKAGLAATDVKAKIFNGSQGEAA
ncbi:COP9 signalosome complex subunit 5 [Thozetella sp. PMI_491]|nr:COP9 signalosome complex subunit 5 [Thozetella sp. PMI_491]